MEPNLAWEHLKVLRRDWIRFFWKSAIWWKVYLVTEAQNEMPAQPASIRPSEFFREGYLKHPWHFVLTTFVGGATCWASLFNNQSAKWDAAIHQAIWIFQRRLLQTSLTFYVNDFCRSPIEVVYFVTEAQNEIHQAIWIFHRRLLETSQTFHKVTF